jgi:hypothetical protein
MMVSRTQTDGWSTTVLPPSSMVISSLGPMLTGMMIEQLALGIVCSQASEYFRYHFSSDRPFSRSIVTSLVILNVFLGIMDTYACFLRVVLQSLTIL